jgi:hypothetical protein
VLQSIKTYLIKRYIIFAIIAGYSTLLITNSFNLINWLPKCPILHYTGFECFGCGLNRAVIELLKGNFSAAVNYNPLIYIYLILVLILLILDYKKFTPKQSIYNGKTKKSTN